VTALSWSDADTGSGVTGRLHVAAGGASLHVGDGAVRTAPDALPLGRNAVAGLSVVGLHLVDDSAAVFAELRRVLRPAGTLVVVVPSATVRSVAELRAGRLLRAVRRGPWPQPGVLDGMGWLLTSADFAVIGDDRIRFALTRDGAEAPDAVVDLLGAAGVWPPALPQGIRDGARSHVLREAPLPVALRRLVARR
jgi:SAM-dependent methyltransferase